MSSGRPQPATARRDHSRPAPKGAQNQVVTTEPPATGSPVVAPDRGTTARPPADRPAINRDQATTARPPAGRATVDRDRDTDARPPAGRAAVNRDRDTAGRPRNARPRDALGRPLPHGAPGVPTTDESVVLTPAEALAEAQRLLDSGAPFHAHEVLEGAWKAAADTEREMWRGLAQLAVGLTHARRGNAAGAARLLHRAAARIVPYGPDAPHGVGVTALAAWARHLAHRIDAGDLAALTTSDLTPRLIP